MTNAKELKLLFKEWCEIHEVCISNWQTDLAVNFMRSVGYNPNNIDKKCSSIILKNTREFLMELNNARTT